MERPDLHKTSERVIEGDDAGVIWQLHEVPYRWATTGCRGQDVLDYGCGTGYGSAMAAASKARSVVGVDVDPAAVGYAEERYDADNLRFVLVEDGLPFPDESFDTVLSFQVIEHVEPDRYLSEARRVLRPGGRLYLATPNREVRLFRFQKPWNPWHLDEFDRAGLEELLLRHFDRITHWGLGGNLDGELRRYRRNRWMTLPVTLPFVPEAIRVPTLRFLSSAKGASPGGPTDGDIRVVEAPPQGSVLLLAVAE